MLNFIYYPVSAILWFWHKVFGYVLGPSSGVAWALSVIFLVFTLRAVLFKPAANQLKTQRQMQEFQPQIKALQKKYAKDRQKLAVEMQKLQKENGFNPLSSCLPILLQAPVFIGLFHVLRSFNRTTGGFGRSAMSVTDNANTANYVFSVSDVQSFLDAKLFGAPLAAQISSTPEQLLVYVTKVGETVTRVDIALVAVPLMIIAGIATHFTARASVARQAANAATAAAATPQTAMMNKLILWVFPLFVVVGGPFFPVAILLYWLSNNGWTLVQQHYLFANMAKQEEAKRADVVERRAATAPKPGAKPLSTKKKAPPTAADPAVDLVKPADEGPASTVAEPFVDPGANRPSRPSAASRKGGTNRAARATSSTGATSSSARPPRKKR
ncbi:membrane protein insertase YidC [Rhodococcus antarcticus]|uniref:Membrane protein insertase YidC n=1 Tax=Rhodococcus antarcticus TaxID=2987751 RepID=A0ABY6NZ64_9NOCA|nr:membrane protein insertase YidC [Rhodococcus antarcticus]UZJ24685.1 membrane protein insertase YidC [Rhodococcus antarcticus]